MSLRLNNNAHFTMKNRKHNNITILAADKRISKRNKLRVFIHSTIHIYKKISWLLPRLKNTIYPNNVTSIKTVFCLKYSEWYYLLFPNKSISTTYVNHWLQYSAKYTEIQNSFASRKYYSINHLPDKEDSPIVLTAWFQAFYKRL